MQDKKFVPLFFYCTVVGFVGSGIDKSQEPGSGINVPDPKLTGRFKILKPDHRLTATAKKTS
jgi:hypothetical protein